MLSDAGYLKNTWTSHKKNERVAKGILTEEFVSVNGQSGSLSLVIYAFIAGISYRAIIKRIVNPANFPLNNTAIFEKSTERDKILSNIFYIICSLNY